MSQTINDTLLILNTLLSLGNNRRIHFTLRHINASIMCFDEVNSIKDVTLRGKLHNRNYLPIICEHGCLLFPYQQD